MADSFVADSFTPDTPQIGESAGAIATGALADTVGLSNRPGRVGMMGAPGTDTPARVLLDPKSPVDYAIRTAVEAPALAVMPGGALGRIAASAGFGGLSGAARGGTMSDAGWGALIDAAVASLAEGVGAGVAYKAGKAAKDLNAAEGAFSWATVAPGEALEAIKSRLPSGKWLSVPSLDRARLTAQEAVERLGKLTGQAYRQARAEIASELSRLDAQRITGPKPYAGAEFKARTSDARFEPHGTAFQRVAQGVEGAAKGPAGRALLDTLATSPIPGTGVPFGAVAATALPGYAQQLWRRAVSP